MPTFTGRPTVSGDDGWVTAVALDSNDTWVAFGEAGTSYHSYFRIPAITIPQGADIILANLTFKAWEARAENTCRLNIYMNDHDDAVAPTNVAEFNALVLATAFTVWDGEGAWVDNNLYTTPDFAPAVREVINRSAWVYGSAMQVIVADDGSDANARRVGDAQDMGHTSAALLTIEWSERGRTIFI